MHWKFGLKVGAAAQQLRENSSVHCVPIAGDGHSRTALTFHNVEGVLRLCVIQLSLAVPRQDLDELALGSMSAPTSLQHSSEQQQHQHQHQHQPHEHEQATCPQSGGVIRDEVGGPRNSVSAAGVSSRSDGSADSLGKTGVSGLHTCSCCP